mmetsp:Transcript_88067/g.189014  ORF Transcript_88067/g.189014 Transcript_88067/m.189014 type:complete len:213 (+) Transcript_88067:66-704(+)
MPAGVNSPLSDSGWPTAALGQPSSAPHPTARPPAAEVRRPPRRRVDTSPAGRCSTTAPRAAIAGLRECPVHKELLIEQDLAIHAPDRFFCLLLLFVLNEGVALYEPRSAIQVEMQVLDVAELCKGLKDIVLLRLLVYPRDSQHPALNGPCWALITIVGQGLKLASLARVAVVILSTTALNLPGGPAALLAVVDLHFAGALEWIGHTDEHGHA